MTTATNIAAYDDDGIWGIGPTREQAEAEAVGFLNTARIDNLDAAIANLKFAPISDDFLDDATGGDDTGEVTIARVDHPFKLDDEGVIVSDPDWDPAEQAETLETHTPEE
jgi:hypothetical protein